MQKKFAAYLILSLLLATSLVARQTPQTWVTYTPPSGKFTAQFPTAPKADHQATNDGGLITEVYTYMSSENGIFFINYMALNAKATFTADSALKSAQDGLFQTGGAKVLTSTKTEYVRGPNDRLPMLEFTGESEISMVKGSAIFDTDHIYTLATLCPKGEDCSATVTKFLSSFKINPAKVAKLIPSPAPSPNSAQQTPQTWVKFTSAEGKFSALFPSQPKPDHQTTQESGFTTDSYTFITAESGLVLAASYMDCDPRSTPNAESDLKSAQDSLVQGAGGQVLTSSKTEFLRGPNSRLPALNFTGVSTSSDIKGFIIFEGYRIYMVFVLSPKAKDFSTVTGQFLNSFALTPISGAKSAPAPAPTTPPASPSAPSPHGAQPSVRAVADSWVSFRSPEGKFSAVFPVVPKPQHQSLGTADEPVESTMFLTPDNGVVWGVSYTDYDSRKVYPVESGLKAEQDSFLKAISATLLTSKRSDFLRAPNDKLPRIEFTGSGADSSTVGWAIVDDHRVYIVMALCPKAKDCGAEETKFFNGFKLTPKN